MSQPERGGLLKVDDASPISILIRSLPPGPLVAGVAPMR